MNSLTPARANARPARGRLLPSRGSTVLRFKRILLNTVLSIAALAAPTSHAQTYAVHWFTVDGGGGTSTGGVYSVRATSGQPDAGKGAGAALTVTGGFWTLVDDTPRLRIRRDGLNVIISWPHPSRGFVLQQTPQLASPPSAIVWTDVAIVPAEDGLEKSVATPATAGHRFFRLTRP